MLGLLEILVVTAPFVAIGALMSLTARAREQRERQVERQIALTDAIHRELGAAAAPEVTRGPRGRWVVRIGVPFHQGALVAALTRITGELFARLDGAGARRPDILLSHRETVSRRTVARTAEGPPRQGLEPAGARRLHAA